MSVIKYKFTFLIFAVLLFVLTVICNAQLKSRVSTFIYGGYGDNIYAVLQGQVYFFIKQRRKTDSLIPLQGARITAIDSMNKVFKIKNSDKTGRFTIEFPYGKFKLHIEKKGYQPILIDNYTSHPDQISDIEIILARGSTKQFYKIHDWTQ